MKRSLTIINSVTELLAANTPTPFLLINHDAITSAYNSFVAAMPDVDIHYAVKCNPDLKVLRTLNDAGCEFEVASAGELSLLQAARIEISDVLFSNPVKRREDIASAYASGVARFVCDNTGELHKLAECAPGSSVYFRLATPPGESYVQSEGKFGTDAEHVVALAREARTLGLNPFGLTFHVGSQMLNPEAWTMPIQMCGQVMSALLEHRIEMSMLNIGGGFPARYSSDVPSIHSYARAIHSAMRRYLPYRPAKLAAEPGRFLAARAGTMVATVLGIKGSWAYLDVGAFNGLIESLETNRQLAYPMSVLNKEGAMTQWSVTGPSCDGQDAIRDRVDLPGSLAEGDIVLIDAAGAYTTGYTHKFCGFADPVVHAVNGAEPSVIVLPAHSLNTAS